MGYSEALEAAGAKVLAYNSTKDWQGTWAAYVEYNGTKGIVVGSYGSCSGCDNFYGTFDYCDEEGPEYQKKLATFGEGYLGAGDIQSKWDIENRLKGFDEASYFDQEEKVLYEWALNCFE